MSKLKRCSIRNQTQSRRSFSAEELGFDHFEGAALTGLVRWLKLTRACQEPPKWLHKISFFLSSQKALGKNTKSLILVKLLSSNSTAL